MCKAARKSPRRGCDLPDLFLEGQRCHLSVIAGGLEEFSVGAVGKNAALVHDVNDIGLNDGAEAVGDDQAGAVGAQSGESSLNEMLRFYIDGGSGLIEEQDGGVFEESACEGEALALSAAQENAAFADFGVEAFRYAANEVFGAGVTQCTPELFIRGGGLADEKVFAHCSCKEEGLLSDIGERLAQEAFAEVLQWDAIERDGAALWIVEASEELEERAFAGTGTADDGDGLLAACTKINFLEHWLVCTVSEANIAKFDVAANVLRSLPRIEVFLGFIIEDCEDTLGGRKTVEEGLVDAVEPGDGFVEKTDEEQELHQLTRCHAALHTPPGAGHEQ